MIDSSLLHPIELLLRLATVLAVFCAALTVMLVALRIVFARRYAKEDAGRKRLVPIFLGGDDPDPGKPSPPIRIAAQIYQELLGILGGAERKRIVAVAVKIGIDGYYRRSLRRGLVATRLAAAEALADFHNEETDAALRAALADRSPRVRLSAAITLSDRADPPPLSWLAPRLRLGEEECSRLVIKLLVTYATTDPAEVKALCFDMESPPSARAAAAEALFIVDPMATLDMVAAILRMEMRTEVEKIAYLRILGEGENHDFRQAILPALADSGWRVRAAAAEAAGRLRMRTEAAQLQHLRRDPNLVVQLRAAEALREIAAPEYESQR